MRIIYKENEKSRLCEMFGIENCLIKEISCDADSRFTMKKEHHHTGFEIHMIVAGCQSYDFSGVEKRVDAGKMIVISPLTKHRTGAHLPETKKISLTFQANSQSPMLFGAWDNGIKVTDAGNRLEAVASELSHEWKTRSAYSSEMADALAYQMLILIMRKLGLGQKYEVPNDTEEDARVHMAKQYIDDNIEQNLKVSDVASYCYMGEKQLTRLFKTYADETPGTYIQRKKCLRIEKLLTENISLGEISERMNFTSEYHFNSFFKKYAGMPPGKYRKMLKNKNEI
ncbi:MAG: helix-turn-helix domain-containing protein [Clostridia bacterium]|nr:helix-turn-helix domain-containing protein [Clostridia bacterium]